MGLTMAGGRCMMDEVLHDYENMKQKTDIATCQGYKGWADVPCLILGIPRFSSC